MRRFAAALFLVGFGPIASASPPEIGPGARAEFASEAEGAKLLSSRDAFVEQMSPFDRGARLKTDQDVTEARYLAFAASQALDWTDAERERLGEVLAAFRRKTAGFDLPLPSVVVFVKTTGLEEGRAAYCRGATVVLPQGVASGDTAPLSETVFHELFHVFRTHNPARRAALYRIVGFAPTAEIALPEALSKRKLTNPDAPRIDSVIRVAVDGRRIPVTPLLLGDADRYDVARGGEFFEQMRFRLLVLDEEKGAFRAAGDTPRLLDPAQIPDYLAQTGRNTGYIIHPEEILADNFVQLVNGRADAPTPRVLEELSAAFRK